MLEKKPMFATRRAGNRWGLTLIELLVTLAIVGILAGLLLPAIQLARETARRIRCANNQKQIGLAISNFESLHGHFPPGRVGCDDSGELQRVPECPPGLKSYDKTAASGFVVVLPQLGHQALHDQFSLQWGGLWNRNVDDLRWYEDKSKRVAVQKRPATFVCSSDSSDPISEVYFPVSSATGSYAFVQGTFGAGSHAYLVKYHNNGLFQYVRPKTIQEVSDGLSNTMMVGEVVLADTWESSNSWTYAIAHADCLRTTANPLNTPPGEGIAVQRQNGAFASQHPGGALFCFVDGRVEFVSDKIDQRVFRGQSTISGGEVIRVP